MVEVLIGPIASGKSTYANKRAKQGAIIINDDSVVNAVHGGNYRQYDKRLKPVYKMVENTIFMTALALGRDVVVDRGLDTAKAARRRWIGMAKSLDVEVRAIVFQIVSPEEHARRRMAADSRGCPYEEWLEAAQRQIAKYELPRMEEGFTQIIHEVK